MAKLARLLHAIPTLYDGTQFRSRLEARWAALFDLLGWAWEYEPVDLPGWIPDFRIGAEGLLVDVTPASAVAAHSTRVHRSGTRGAVALLSDAPQLPGSAPGGLLVGLARLRRPRRGRGGRWYPLALRGGSCGFCGVCLALDAERAKCLLGGGETRPLEPGELVELRRRWRLAGNAVQWRGASAVP